MLMSTEDTLQDFLDSAKHEIGLTLTFCSLLATNKAMVRVVHYVTEDGRDYFDEWLQCQDAEIRARVQTRIDRIELGNFGDHKGVD